MRHDARSAAGGTAASIFESGQAITAEAWHGGISLALCWRQRDPFRAARTVCLHPPDFWSLKRIAETDARSELPDADVGRYVPRGANADGRRASLGRPPARRFGGNLRMAPIFS